MRGAGGSKERGEGGEKTNHVQSLIPISEALFHCEKLQENATTL